MEKKHKNKLQSMFPRATNYKQLDVLDIPDDYKSMGPELVETLKAKVDDT